MLRRGPRRAGEPHGGRGDRHLRRHEEHGAIGAGTGATDGGDTGQGSGALGRGGEAGAEPAPLLGVRARRRTHHPGAPGCGPAGRRRASHGPRTVHLITARAGDRKVSLHFKEADDAPANPTQEVDQILEDRKRLVIQPSTKVWATMPVGRKRGRLLIAEAV